MVAKDFTIEEHGAGVNPKRIHSLPDRRLRSKSSAEEARRIAHWVQSDVREEPAPPDMAVFEALHVCAYRATRQPRNKRVSRAERRRWAARWRMLRDYLVEKSLGLAYSGIQRFGRKNVDRVEQRSEALLALMRAVEGFNPWRGVQFSTYACNAITRALIQLSMRTARRRDKFPVEHEAWRERPAREEGWSELYADRLHRALDENLGELTDHEAAVLGWRFPLGGGRSLTFVEIGNAIGLSRERARQIQEKALSKLRRVLESDPVLQ
jgi:RNA polymerase sigma factor (sigma-70 family)